MAVSLPTAQPPSVNATAAGYGFSAFGLDVRADFALPGARPLGSAPGADLELRLVARDELLPLMDEPRRLRLLHQFSGCGYAMLDGPEGDTLICYGFRGLFHLSADRRMLRCAPTDQADPYWQRELLDTVLWSVSLMRGFELLHASSVDTPAGVVAFVAMSGGGKSSLAAEYLRRGARLFCDDILALAERNGEVVGFPGPAVMNLPAAVDPPSVGATPIAELGGERWVETDPPPREPRPVAAVVLVDRAPGHEPACVRIDATTLSLLPHTLGLPHVERSKQRFELFGRVAQTVPILHLTADTFVPTGALADLVDARIAAP